MTEQTPEEQAREIAHDYVEPGIVADLVADIRAIARAHAERETAALRALNEALQSANEVQLRCWRAAEDELAALRARLERVEKAAGPFALYAKLLESYGFSGDDDESSWAELPGVAELTAGHFRALRDAIIAEPTPLQNPEDKA